MRALSNLPLADSTCSVNQIMALVQQTRHQMPMVMIMMTVAWLR